MDNMAKIKLFLISLYLGVALLFFYDDHFLLSTSPLYTYDTISLMTAVFSLGIIASAGVYNLAFYFYIRRSHYLYYALAQFSIIALLIQIEGLFIAPFVELYGFDRSLFYLEISQILVLIFSLLFIEKFLSLYQISQVKGIIHVVIGTALLDLVATLILGHSIIIKFIPSFIWVLLILTEAHRLIETKDPPFYFLSIGWYGVIAVSIVEFAKLIDRDFTFPFLHVAFAMESLLLSFALSYKFKIIEIEKERHQADLLRQSRLASMGEIISTIAHQWRQPLNFLSFALMHIRQQTTDQETVQETIQEANRQLQYMSQTIENFRNFYSPAKTKEPFSIYQACQDTLAIIQPVLESIPIQVTIDLQADFTLHANRNEFQQVILNLIHNAKDAYILNHIPNGTIEITIDTQTVQIKDCAGGIAPEHIAQIFDPYFSTKPNGEGLGLYIAKMIVEQQMGGRFRVEVIKECTCFIMRF